MKSSLKILTASVLAGAFFISTQSHADSQAEADAAFAASNWAEASTAYEALLRADEANGANWFRLAQARHQLGDYVGARDAYRRALDAGFQPAPRARFHLARALMSNGERDAALAELEEIARTGGPTHRVLRGASEFDALAGDQRFEAVIAALTPCNAAAYRHFDFWIGKWDVTASGSPTPTASSKISAQQDGCVIREEYDAGGITGVSMNFYDAAIGKWRQTWMSNGGVLYLQGGLSEDGAMVMTDRDLAPGDPASVNRITWTPNDDGSVRQLWDSSSDDGETWTVVYDGLYTPKVK